ncbi:M23 family metallopeptidase [Pseudomonas borbori]
MSGYSGVAPVLTVASLFLIGTSSFSVGATEINQSAFNFTTQDLQRLAPSSIRLPFSNELFLYGQDAEAFDLESYLAVNAPFIRDKKELIAHWSGYYSISPKVLLTLMELQSGLISAPSKEKLKAPFAALSKQHGFEKQLRDVLAQLSQRFYGFEAYQRNRARASDKALNADPGTLNGATAAILGVLQQPGDNPAALAQVASLNNFSQTFSQLFNTSAKQMYRFEPIEQAAITAAAIPPTTLLQLPWYQGYSWKSNGAHSHTGSGSPYSSIDVSYDWPRWGAQTYSVVAAHAGRVTVFSRCQVRITHANGWATNYYHMDGIRVSNGENVVADTKLGVYASNRNNALCQGGSSTGPHLHFSLLYNGRYVSLQGVNLGPFRVNVGAYNYDNVCSRFYFYNVRNNNYQCAWSALYNSGPLN